MRRKKTSVLMSLISAFGSSLFLFAAAGDGALDDQRCRTSSVRGKIPLTASPNAVAAGAKLFRQNCASCHGSEALGMKKRPNLHSERVRAATPGELEWLLKNGSMKNGMPSWSRLPEQQRWQIVAFLKSLQ